MSNVLGAKGQIVIEKAIRESLGLEAGYVAVQRLVEDHVEIHFYPAEHNRSLFGALAPYVTKSLPQEQWPEIREQAWAAAIRDEVGEGSTEEEHT